MWDNHHIRNAFKIEPSYHGRKKYKKYLQALISIEINIFRRLLNKYLKKNMTPIKLHHTLSIIDIRS